MLSQLKKSSFDPQTIDRYILQQVYPYFNEHLSGYLEANQRKQKLRESLFALQNIQDGTKCSQWFKKHR